MCGEESCMKQKSLQYKIAIWLTMGLLVVDPVVMPFSYAEHPIEVDRQAPQDRQAQVTQAGNGVTLVNVTGPTAGGVSRNDYTKFNVPESGTILNNSYGMSNTTLAGYIPGNANMARGAARVILNEVTSTNPTAMKGFIEVAGQKASVVVANPNGISVDGGGFINTDRAVLTTGKPELTADGNIQTYRVEQGAVSVNGKGLNAKGANALQILTEAAHINAGVWANEADVRTGKNVVDANTLDTQRIGTSNQVGLDVAAIGGMYANAITMKGSNTGLGVNVKGVVSSAKATNITSDGRIIVSGGVTSNGNTAITGQAVAVGRSGIVQGDAGTTVDSQTTVDNEGLINSGGITHVEAGTVDNHDGGRVYGDAVSIKANHVNNHTNRELEERYHKGGDALKAAKKALDDEWNADVTVYKTQEELAAHKQRIQHLTKAYDEAQTQLTAIETEFASHTSGTIAGRKEVDVDAKHVTNKGRGLIYSGSSMRVTAKEDLTNTGATIKSAGAMTIDAPAVKNENAAFGAKRVSDGVTKNPDKLKVNDPNHKLEGQVFDKSEFPYADDSSGYGTPRVIPVHSEKDEAYNKEMNKWENRVHKFTIIRSQAEHTHTDITHDDPGVISSGGDMTVSGAIHNTNSRIVAGGTVRTSGKIDNQSDEVSEKTIATGTTQESYTKRVRKSHGIGHKRRRAWNAEVFMTPSVTEQNVKPVGVIKDHAEEVLSASTMAKVSESLDPYGLGKGNGKRSGTIDGLSLPTESLYRIHPEITANALVETDPAFTDRKQFLSSQYMINALNQDPDRRLKRLGDGFYEQQLVNQQILAATGRQYLTGYTDNEAEYKALLEAGIAYGKRFNLTPGITLSDAQMQAITTDMVWLETKTMVVNGKEQKVLYPKVYLAKQSAKGLDAMGGLISGRAIVSETDADIRNQGVMTADTIVLNGQNIHNTGTIDGRTVAVAAKQDVNSTGAIHGDTHVVVSAGRDVNVGARVKALSNQDVVRRQGTVGVSEPGGQLSIAANRDIHLKGALVQGGANTTMDITDGHDVNLGTEQLAAKKDMTINGDNYNRTDRRTELGTTVLGDGDVTIRAGHDVSVRNGVVNSEQGTTTMAAGHDVNVTPGESYSRDEYGIKYKEKSLLSKTVRTLRTDHEHTGVLSSTIGGNAVDMKANHDVSLTGANVLGTKDINITAGHDVRTDSGEERQRDDIYEHSKKTGLMSAGIGFTIGSKKVTDTLDGKYMNQVETLIGAAKGQVAIHANKAAHLTSASILAGTDATVQAPEMILDGKHNTADIKQTHEVKTSGLTVSLGGSIASALNGAYALQQKGKDRHDKRLGALEYVEAGKELRKGLTNINEYRAYTPANVVNHADGLMDSGLQKMDFSARLDRLASSGQLSEKQLKTVTGMRDRFAVEGAQEYQTGFNEMADIQGDQAQYKAQKRAKKDGLANIHVGIGSSYSKSVTELHNHDYAGGKIISNNTTSLLAKSNAPNTGTITAIGETIQGKTVDVVADNTINLQAATNTSRKIENNDTKSWSVGANISVNGGGILGFDANYNKGMQRENTEKVSYAPSRITANTVNMNSGKDTNVIGSTVKGDKVIANVGGNLYIQSLQDKEIYVGKHKNTGFSVSTNGTQLGSISGEHSKGDTRSNYASVTEQAGIFAGKDGYTITTKGTTTLEGAVIDSKAAAEKNTVSTGRLAMKDIENTAEYSSKNIGISYNHIGNFKSLSQAGQDAVYNSLGLLPKLLPESKDSAHSTTKSAIADGTITVHDESVDIRSISRDTANSLNKLDKIFDKKKVEERQELARLFAKDAFEQLHYWEPKTKEEKVAKAIAHGVVEEVSARVAGNKPGSGFYAGVTNEALIGEIQKVAKINPAVAQWLSAGVGAVVNAGLGKPVITGAAEAQYGTKWNEYQTIKNIKEQIEELKAGKSVKVYGRDIKLESLRENEWLALYGIDPITHEYRYVAINKQGESYDIKHFDRFENDYFTNVINTNNLFTVNKGIVAGSGTDIPIKKTDEYLIKQSLAANVQSGAVIRYNLGDYNGNIFEGNFYEKVRPSFARKLQGAAVDANIDRIDLRHTYPSYILMRLKDEGRISQKFANDYKVNFQNNNFILQSTKSPNYKLALTKEQAYRIIGTSDYYRELEKMTKLGANQEGYFGLGVKHGKGEVDLSLIEGMNQDNRIFIGGELRLKGSVTARDIVNLFQPKEMITGEKVTAKSILKAPLVPVMGRKRNDYWQSGFKIDKPILKRFPGGDTLIEVDVPIAYRTEIESVATKEAISAVREKTNNAKAEELVAMAYHNAHPKEGNFYYDENRKTKSLIKKVDSVTHKYEILDSDEHWHVLPTKVFDDIYRNNRVDEE